MRIASFILPLTDNDSKSLAAVHESVRADLIEAFGGFSAVEISGGWKDEETGKLYVESSVRYEIAADWSKLDRAGKPRLLNRFFNLCGRFCEEASQIVIFATAPDGECYMVAPGVTEAPREIAPREGAAEPVSWRALNERLADAA